MTLCQQRKTHFKANLEIIKDRAKKLSEVLLRITLHSLKFSYTAIILELTTTRQNPYRRILRNAVVRVSHFTVMQPQP